MFLYCNLHRLIEQFTLVDILFITTGLSSSSSSSSSVYFCFLQVWQQYDAATSVKITKRDPDAPPSLQHPATTMTNGFIPQHYVATAYVPGTTTVPGQLSTIDYNNVVTSIPGMNTTGLPPGVQPAVAAPGPGTDSHTSSAAYTAPIG